jgi:hypothetical protein
MDISSLINELTYLEWGLIILSGMLIGMAKTGLSGIGTLAIPIMAIIFGGKPSTGIVLPMLIMGDVMAVWYYNRDASWKYILKVIPWALAGIVVAVIIGNAISEKIFTYLMGFAIFSGLGIMVWNDVRKNKKIPDYLWFSVFVGVLGGFSTMIGNAAGAIMSIYLLSMRLPKNSFIGTKAWFFMLINISKVPFHIFSWHTITINSLFFDLLFLPAIIIGAFIGFRIVKLIPEKPYRIFVIIMVFISSVVMIVKASS